MSASELRHIIWEQSWVDIFALPQVLLRRDTYAILGTPSLRVLWDIALGALIFLFKVIFAMPMALLVESPSYHMGACLHYSG